MVTLGHSETNGRCKVLKRSLGLKIEIDVDEAINKLFEIFS